MNRGRTEELTYATIIECKSEFWKGSCPTHMLRKKSRTRYYICRKQGKERRWRHLQEANEAFLLSTPPYALQLIQSLSEAVDLQKQRLAILWRRQVPIVSTRRPIEADPTPTEIEASGGAYSSITGWPKASFIGKYQFGTPLNKQLA